MSDIQTKHIDVVASMEEFQTNLNAGVYIAPWVVYVGNGTDGYTVLTSSTQGTSQVAPDALEALSVRVDQLENERVFLLETQYEELVKNGSVWINDGKTEIKFNSNHLYYIYEPEEDNNENEGENVEGEIENGDFENIDNEVLNENQ